MIPIIQQLQQQAADLQRQINAKRQEREAMERMMVQKKVEPLERQIAELQREIDQQLHDIYQPYQTALHNQLREVQSQLDAIKVQEAAGVWYPVGSVVWEWQQARWSKEWSKTGNSGVVAVYDGKQELPENMRWQKPDIADIIVQLRKKDGSIGKKIENMGWQDGKVLNPNTACRWCIEGETPTDNILTRREKV